jgi:hypothetical protein
LPSAPTLPAPCSSSAWPRTTPAQQALNDVIPISDGLIEEQGQEYEGYTVSDLWLDSTKLHFFDAQSREALTYRD